MQSSLAFTALLMGLVGGPHCVAMCGAACVGIGQAAGKSSQASILQFQVGRVLGYAGLGGLAAASMQGLGWLTIQSAALRPVWSLFHVAATLLGLVLLIQARQPVWLESGGRKVWNAVRGLVPGRGQLTPLIFGVIWALLPCGLLYSALLVAGLAGSAVAGAAVMALFALGTSVTMTIGPWLWLRLHGNSASKKPGGGGDWGVRLAGAALAISSAWALWMGLMHNSAPWCATP
ncbi:MAG: sulfite exporter TauE/SafE family protein [Rhodoferax sp.]|nr:sulfite exporter TauE/SafE family protein [Rhodoferax sp.]